MDKFSDKSMKFRIKKGNGVVLFDWLIEPVELFMTDYLRHMYKKRGTAWMDG